MVAPRSTPPHLLQFNHPFASPLKTYLQECQVSLSQQAQDTFDEARRMGVLLRHSLSPEVANEIRADIADTNLQQRRHHAVLLGILCSQSR